MRKFVLLHMQSNSVNSRVNLASHNAHVLIWCATRAATQTTMQATAATATHPD
jgi:hypothetical protein